MNVAGGIEVPWGELLPLPVEAPAPAVVAVEPAPVDGTEYTAAPQSVADEPQASAPDVSVDCGLVPGSLQLVDPSQPVADEPQAPAPDVSIDFGLVRDSLKLVELPQPVVAEEPLPAKPDVVIDDGAVLDNGIVTIEPWPIKVGEFIKVGDLNSAQPDIVIDDVAVLDVGEPVITGTIQITARTIQIACVMTCVQLDTELVFECAPVGLQLLGSVDVVATPQFLLA